MPKTSPLDHQPDLIVMGRTGLTALERVLVGSVTAYVQRFAPCDVLTRPHLTQQKTVTSERHCFFVAYLA